MHGRTNLRVPLNFAQIIVFFAIYAVSVIYDLNLQMDNIGSSKQSLDQKSESVTGTAIFCAYLC